jgi:hypothetical protein
MKLMFEITAAVSGAVGVVSTAGLTCGAGREFGMVIVAGGAGSRPAVSVGVPGFGAGAEVCAGGMTGVDVAATGATATAGAASEIVAGAVEVGAGAGVDDGAGVTARGGAVTTGATTTAGVAGDIEAGADGVGFAAGCKASGGGAGFGALDGIEAGVAAFSVRTIDAPLTGAEDAGGTGAGTRAGTGSVVGSAPAAAE